ncbi:hypothetical protein [Rhizobacter sp. P5_C2]
MKPFLMAVALLVIAAQAHGQTAPLAKYSSREEYRACFKEEDALKAQKAVFSEQTKAHGANLKRVQDELQAHVATQPKPGQADDAAVDAFNDKIDALNARVDASNQEAERLNQETRSLNAKVAALNRRCAGMVVSHADHVTVLKERAAFGKQK